MDIIDKIKALPDGKKLVYAVSTNEVVHGYNYACTTDDLKALVAQLKWIPVSDRLPEGSLSLHLVSLKNNCVYQATYSNFSNRWFVVGVGEIDDNNPVIAWRPMPEPYTAERGEEKKNA